MIEYDPEWYKCFFGQDYLDVYDHLLTEEGSETESDFVRRALDLSRATVFWTCAAGPAVMLFCWQELALK